MSESEETPYGLDAMPGHTIAVIGMACQLPGAPNPEALWRLLRAGDSAVRPTPADRLRLGDADAEGKNDTEGAGTGTETGSGECGQCAEEACRWDGFLDEVERFDAGFFGVSPQEADLMDSQQRLVLELAQEALEDSRIVPDAHGGTRAGVFIEAAHDDYATLLHRLGDANGFVRGEGGGLVVLKQLDRALADGDPVRAVIRGSAVNNDCGGDTLTAPDQGAQEEVVRRALRNAGTTLLSLESLLRQTAQELGPTTGCRPGNVGRRCVWRHGCATSARTIRRRRPRPWSGRPASASGRNTARGDERELLVALLHSAAASAELPADRIARLTRQVLNHAPATAAQVHTLVPLTVPLAVGADSVEGLLPWLDEMTTLSSMALIMVALRIREPELAASLPDRLRGPAGNCWFRGLRTLVRGLEAERRDEPDLALEHFTEAGYLLERAGWRNPAFAPWEYWAARVHRRRGNVERAEELSARHLEQACKWGAPATLGRALALRATLTGAVVLLRLAETVAPYRAHEAEQALPTAYDPAVACNAPWVAAGAQEVLGPTAVGGAAPVPLTPTERMVEKHLTSRCRKMSTSGRPGLAAALKDAGLFGRGRPEGRTVPFQLRLRLRLRPRPGRSAPRSARRGRSARQRRVR